MKYVATIMFALFFSHTYAQLTLENMSNSEAVFSIDSVCVGEEVVFGVVENPVLSYKWYFGEDASVSTTGGAGPHAITFHTAGLKTIQLEISTGTVIEIITQNIFVEAKPDAQLVADLASGYKNVYHYGLALEALPETAFQSGSWYIKTGASNNTGFVGDVENKKVGFYNFDYSPKVVCRKVENNSGLCSVDEACVQLTRFDCNCPIAIERNLEVCITDTQFFLVENCCFNPVPEIGDTTYWESQNNVDFQQASLISIVTTITRPGNYKYNFHFNNDLLDQVENYTGQFNVKVKNNKTYAAITEDDYVATCEEEHTLHAVKENDAVGTWSIVSGEGVLVPGEDDFSVTVIPTSIPSVLNVNFTLDNAACLATVDDVEVDFEAVYPDVSSQSVTVNDDVLSMQLNGNPIPEEGSSFTAFWSAEGPATITDGGEVSNLVEGENVFYYTTDHERCGVAKDSVSITVVPVLTSLEEGVSSPAVKAYPSPVEETLIIEFSKIPESEVDVVLYDLIGNPITNSTNSGSKYIKLEFSEVSEGMYVVLLNYEERTTQFKIIKR